MRSAIAFVISLLFAIVSAGYDPVTEVQGETVAFTLKFVQSSIALVHPANDLNSELYKITIRRDLFFTPNMNITDVQTGELVAAIKSKLAGNPFDLDYDMQIRNDSSGQLVEAELDFDYFFIWNKFDIEMSGGDNHEIKYKLMCGLGSRTCNIIVQAPKQPTQVLALIESGKNIGEYSVVISRGMPVGVGLVGAYFICYRWNQENVRIPQK